MAMYEIKLRIDPETIPTLITQLGLEKLRSFTDTDTFLSTEPGHSKEKIKELDTTIKLYRLQFDGTCFVIEGQILTPAQAQELKRSRTVSAVVKRAKEEYMWQELGLTVAFDTIEGVAGTVFFEIYGKTHDLVLRARDNLKALGYDTWEQRTYDDVVNAQASLL
ncbi:MAG: hypothetical protein WC289_00150 [Patescibacteria group bacterium]|jgi:hypothetical protein